MTNPPVKYGSWAVGRWSFNINPEARCATCNHTLASHAPDCGALDASGDICDCDLFQISLFNTEAVPDA